MEGCPHASASDGESKPRKSVVHVTRRFARSVVVRGCVAVAQSVRGVGPVQNSVACVGPQVLDQVPVIQRSEHVQDHLQHQSESCIDHGLLSQESTSPVLEQTERDLWMV